MKMKPMKNPVMRIKQSRRGKWSSLSTLFAVNRNGLQPIYFVNTLLKKIGVLKYMSEVIISRSGGNIDINKIKDAINESKDRKLVTQVINKNTKFIMPGNIYKNQVEVRIFGGGGGAYISGELGSYGGGGGWMNNAILVLNPYVNYGITIGSGGKSSGNTQDNGTGGTTSFGALLSASGGSPGRAFSGGSGGSGGSVDGRVSPTYAGDGYQFGGGGGGTLGGDGGTWGGGGGGKEKGGNGGYYGGGGGGSQRYSQASSTYYSGGGNGGYYGGGGGSRSQYNTVLNSCYGGWYYDNGTWKSSGYGGNGGFNDTIIAGDGINTVGWTNVLKDSLYEIYICGNGIHGNANGSGGGGGGGFGGNGSNAIYRHHSGSYYYWGGGGGGYGGDAVYNEGIAYGGGGGGFGGNGMGGGGGYGRGADSISYIGGGGGYYSQSSDLGGAGYLIDGIHYGYGGDKINNGTDGVCILSYYQYV